MNKIIGIDLGTTNSCVAVLVDGQAVVIPNAEGQRTTPSVVVFMPDGQRLVGVAAKRQQLINPRNTIASIKRFMGRKWQEVTEEMAMVSYEVARGERDEVGVVIAGQHYAPPEISAMILQKLKQDAEAYLGETVTDAVITVPAYFNHAQREATKDAGKIAGLNVLRILNEPTAASLAYGLDQTQEQTVLVYDLGGGTFDVSVLELAQGLFDVKATHGDNHLGGDNFDQAIVQWMLAAFEQADQTDFSRNALVLARLYQAAEQAKIALSSRESIDIHLPFIRTEPVQHLSLTLTRNQLNTLTEGLLQQTVRPIQQALADAGLTPAGIDHLVMVGGMTRMPAVVEKLTELIRRVPHQGVDPDEVVAVGAAIQAGVLGGEIKGVLLLDVIPLSLGIETKGGVFTRLIPRNASIPLRKTETFTTATDNQTSVEIHVLQGESDMAAFNKTLGIFQLVGITPARRGLMEIDVSFDVDANGILHVHAEDITTGNEQTIEIQSGTGLSATEVERMVKAAETHATATHLLRELAEVRNLAEVLTTEIARSLSAYRSKINEQQAAAIENEIKNLREILAGKDIGMIRNHTKTLTAAAQVLTSKGVHR
ncbi:MAG: molecular chaperone DnaK [Gallionella sp.]